MGKKEIYDEGRTIADMNVKGMPVYVTDNVEKSAITPINLIYKERKVEANRGGVC